MRMRRLAVAGALAFVLGACGDDTTEPGVVKLEGVVVASPTLSLQAGQRQTITALGVGTGMASLAGVTFSYSSGTPTVAVVSSTGQVTGLSAGTSSITVTGTLDGVSKTTNVNVTVAGTLPNALTVVAGSASNDFTPAFAVIARGGTVSWTFPGRVHNVVFQGSAAGTPANIPDTGNQPVGVPRTFNSGGTFDYACTRHPGMSGTVMVP